LVVIGKIAAVALSLGCFAAFAQDSASLTVTVVDPSAAIVLGAKVTLTDLRKGTVSTGETNENGFVAFNLLPPGEYWLDVKSTGFQEFHVDHLMLQVRDRQTLQAALKLKAAAGTTVVVTSAAQVVSNDTAQGISVDQQYVQNLPTNGRNAESLILMAPGITTAAGGKGGGGFNANGLRSNTNYYTMDGVSVNSGGPSGGPGGGPGGPGGGGGPAPGAGSSTEMISIDALQEMKVQTSSMAPEFGRSPGAQVVMTSRGGGNNFHGSLSYYKRSDAFDANDWFANSGGYPKGRERQDRPGGVFGGPIVRSKTFFFVSIEHLKLQSPQTVVADVPDLAARKAASAALRPFLNAFPYPNGAELGSGAAEYRAVLSNPSSSSSASIRLDHTLNQSTTLFARYSQTPSNSVQRGSQMSTPNIVQNQSSRSQLATAGVTRVIGDSSINDLRVNYSDSNASGYSTMDSYGGAVPLTDSLVFPSGVTSANGSFSLSVIGVAGYSYGGHSANRQQQVNVVDSFTTTVREKHHVKAGADYRRQLKTSQRTPYSTSVSFEGVTGYSESLLTGIALNGQVSSSVPTVYPTYTNLSAYGQDTWRLTERTTVTYGLRWDLNPAPTTRQGPKPFALSDSNIAGVTQNESIYPTRWFDVAPRFGVAYLSDDTPGREMMLRAGMGVFYDMGYGVVDSAFMGAPYSNQRTSSLVKFPFTEAELVAPTLPPTRPYGQITTGGAGLKSPVVYQINGTWEKNLGPGQTLSVGASATRGHNLMRTATQPSFSDAYTILREVSNGASSSYNGMQVQFRKRFSNNFQTQWSYGWAHSIDSSSNDAGFGGGFASLFGGGERGSSDYDIRHNLSLSGSIKLPSVKGPLFFLLQQWNLDFVAAARSALPFDIQGVSTCTSASTSSTCTTSTSSTNNGLFAQVRPNYVGGQAIWIADSKVPGGRRVNKAAFSIPSGYAQGNLGRNALRGFSFGQLDLSLRRTVPISGRLQLSIAAQGYNVFNHPNFANPSQLEGGNMSSPNFGIATQMMNQSFGGGVNQLYRSGGPRSMELSIRVQF
jgi:outer membrane receptor protein involved in Fe transport